MANRAKKLTYRANQFEVELNNNTAKILDCITYSTRKLWNVTNYRLQNIDYKNGETFPSFYELRNEMSPDFWYKNLPSHSADATVKLLHSNWKAFFTSIKNNSIKNSKPPRYKNYNFNVTYTKAYIRVIENESGSRKLRLSIGKQMKPYLKETHGIHAEYIYIKIPKNIPSISTENLKTVDVKPIGKPGGTYTEYKVIITQDIPSQTEDELRKTEKFLSIDIGVKNALTCFSYTGNSHIISGSELRSIERYFYKTIAGYQSTHCNQQTRMGVKHPRYSKRTKQLYKKRSSQVEHWIHCATKKVVEIAQLEGVETIVVGNIKGILNKGAGSKAVNIKMHMLPFDKMIYKLKYKAEAAGVLVDAESIKEHYTSQTCSFCKSIPSKKNAVKSDRKHRGLFVCSDCGSQINADVNGAINIAKKYIKSIKKTWVPVVPSAPIKYKFNRHYFLAK